MRDLNKVFGQYLKEIRINQGLSQEELAFQSGFHRTYISLLERGIKSPTLDTVFKLCNTLKYPVEKLIVGVVERIKEIEDV